MVRVQSIVICQLQTVVHGGAEGGAEGGREARGRGRGSRPGVCAQRECRWGLLEAVHIGYSSGERWGLGSGRARPRPLEMVARRATVTEQAAHGTLYVGMSDLAMEVPSSHRAL